ncbi:response regulator transcription factor [Larkinella sp.]|uniref:response regulator transcription factor n=1 Tax=Larkinella sp. TaxID=2034517 RepID=UPI003BAADF1A
MENHKFNLLIAEHSPFLRNVFQETLASEFNLTLVSNYNEIVSQLEAGSAINFIITDLDGPQADGVESISRFRNHSRYQHVPMLVLSGKNDSEVRIQCLENGADDCMAKPFNPLELRAKIGAMLRRSPHTVSWPVAGTYAQKGTAFA